jgi:choline dehydrogenase-like flavoprotein
MDQAAGLTLLGRWPGWTSMGLAMGAGEVFDTDFYSLPHVVGTSAMGPRPDDGAVVHATGCVHGTQRLSVVDASIIPDAPSGFTHILTIRLAEHLAALIASQP